jgi:hypothetical protein
MKLFKTTITVERAEEDFHCEISALIEVENRRFFVSGFRSQIALSPKERVEAEDLLIDQARCYPSSGIEQ